MMDSVQRKSLRLVQVVCRHGNKEEDSMTAGVMKCGLLTKEGERKARAVGNFLKQFYDGFLGETIDEVSVRSSEIERCIQTAVEILKGIYKELESKEWTQLESMVERKPKHLDNMIYPGCFVPSVADEMKRISADRKSKLLQKHQASLSKLSQKRPLSRLIDFFIFREDIFRRRENGQPLPDDVDQETLQEVEEICSLIPLVYFDSEKLILNRASNLIQKWVENMDNVVSGDNEGKKLHLFSTHDLMLVILHLALKTYDGKFPLYGDCFLVELHELDGQHSVLIRYLRVEDGKELGPPTQIYPKEEGQFMPLIEFKREFKAFLDNQVEQEEPLPNERNYLQLPFFPWSVDKL